MLNRIILSRRGGIALRSKAIPVPKIQGKQSHRLLRGDRFVALAAFIILHSSSIIAPARAQDTEPLSSPFHAGFRANYLENLHQTTAQILVGCPECGTFSNGTGSGYDFEAFGEVPFNFLRALDLSFGLGFVERGGAFGEATTGELTVLDPGNDSVYEPLTRQHTFTASLKYINVTGGVRFTPLAKYGGYVSAELDAGIPVGRSTTYTQTESIVSPQGVVYPQTQTTTLTDGQGTIVGVNTLFGLRGTIGWELPVGPTMTASPELSYYLPLNSVSTSYVWHVSSISAGVAIRWNEPPKPDSIPVRPPPPPPIVERDNPSAFAPKLDISSVSGKPLRLVETTVTETFPLLPYLFFDSASAAIPDRYAQLSPGEAQSFRESDLPHRSLESYYQLLNVIGSRMRSNPNAMLTINGTTDGREAGSLADALARNRAERVRSYLTDTWGIGTNRMKLTTSATPRHPSSTQYEAGFEENRRVELSSEDDRILAPIVHERFREESAVPKSLPFSLSASSKLGIRDWDLAIRSHGTKIYETSGHNVPPTTLQWVPTDGAVEALAKQLLPSDSLELVLRASAPNGAETEESIAVPASKSINPFELSRLSLIVFDFDQARIDSQNQQMISQFVAKSFYPASTATIVGSTDELGELAHNQELSTTRADNVRDLILADKPDAKITSTKGIGPSDLLYDNHLPEGRYYCRTVRVEVATPLTSILTGEK